MKLSRSAISWVCGLACLSAVAGFGHLARADVVQLQKNFQTPPDDARIMVRWWWFGPAVTADGIERELKAMKAGGIGGFEVQPTYPLVVDGGTGENAAKNIKWMSPEFLNMLGVTATKAKELGMRMDVTLGSGWPYGGPMFNQQTEGTKALGTQVVAAPAGQRTVQTTSRTAFAAFAGPGGLAATGGGGRGGRGGGAGGPGAAPGGAPGGGAPVTQPADAAAPGAAAPIPEEAFFPAAIPGGGRGGPGGGGGNNVDLTGFKEIPLVNGVAQLPAGWAGGQVVFFEYRSAGLTAVKRPAYGADGPIIDHLSAKTVDKFIQLVAEPELKACGVNPPFSIFCDSLEVSGENWTEDFLPEFQKRRGYDLKPLLPALIGNVGPRTADIRHDFGQTVTDLFNENFNAKFTALAKKYNSRFRIQGYGNPPAGELSFAFADLPEGEAGGNANWRTFRATRYAASASHLMGQRLASSETFTWLHQAPFRAVPLDIKTEVDTHFLEGINQVDCHGWPYTPNGMPYPGASFYAAAVFDDKNPWYVAMPEITGYMQRVSQMLREGTPANDIALYGNDSDTWTGAGPGFSSMNGVYTSQTAVLDAVLDTGYNLDLMDDGMLKMKGKVEGGKLVFGDVKYGVVLLNGPQNMPLETARKLEEFAKGGGILVWVSARERTLHVPGYKATPADQEELTAIFGRLFGTGGPGLVATTAQEFTQVVGPKLGPDFALSPAVPQIGAIHRHTDGGELYFVANTSPTKQSVRATFRQAGTQPEQWNPLNGKIQPLAIAAKTASTTSVALELEPYGSTVVVFTNRQLPAPAAPAASTLDLSTGWSVKFAAGPGGTGAPVQMDKLVSWTTLPAMANYSGVASYEKKVTISAEMAKSSVVLSFGATTPNGPAGGGGRGGRGGGAGGAPATAAAPDPVPETSPATGTAPGRGGRGGAAGGGGGGQGVAAAVSGPVKDAAVVFVNDQRIGAAWCAPFTVDLTGALKEGENTIRIEVGNTAVNYLAKAGFPNYNQRAVDAMFPPGNRFAPQGMNQYAQPLPSGLLGPIKIEPGH